MDSADYQKKKSAKTLLLQNSHSHTLKAGVGQTSNNSISKKSASVNTFSKNNSNSSPHSDREHIDVYELLGKTDVLQKRNEALKKDVENLKELVL